MIDVVAADVVASLQALNLTSADINFESRADIGNKSYYYCPSLDIFVYIAGLGLTVPQTAIEEIGVVEAG